VFSYNFLFALEVSWVIFNLEMLKNRINIDIIKIPNKNIRRRLYFLLKKNIRNYILILNYNHESTSIIF
jgi:hypothetical protein